MRLVFSIKLIVNTLIIIACMLIAASIAGQIMKYVFGHPTVHGLVRLFNVSNEQNIPTLFSVLLLISCSILLNLACYLDHKQAAGLKMFWVTLATGFAFMAIDEFVQLHENIGFLLKPLIGTYSHGFLYFSWVIPAMALMLFLAVFYSSFLFRLPKKTRINFILAGIVYLTGLLGIEMLGGYYYELHAGETLTYSLISNLEESLEMFGLILFIRALLNYLSAHFSELSIHLKP